MDSSDFAYPKNRWLQKHKLEEELDSHILNSVNPDEYLSSRTLSSSNKRSRLSSSGKAKLQEPTVPKRVDPESHSSEFTRLLVQDLYYKPPEESEPFSSKQSTFTTSDSLTKVHLAKARKERIILIETRFNRMSSRYSNNICSTIWWSFLFKILRIAAGDDKCKRKIQNTKFFFSPSFFHQSQWLLYFSSNEIKFSYIKRQQSNLLF